MTNLDEVIHGWIGQFPERLLAEVADYYSKTPYSSALNDLKKRFGLRRALAKVIRREIDSGLTDVTLSHYFRYRNCMLVGLGDPAANRESEKFLKRYEKMARSNPSGQHATALIEIARFAEIRNRFADLISAKYLSECEEDDIDSLLAELG